MVDASTVDITHKQKEARQARGVRNGPLTSSIRVLSGRLYLVIPLDESRNTDYATNEKTQP